MKGKGKAPLLPSSAVKPIPLPKGKGHPVATADDYDLIMSYDDNKFDDPNLVAQEANNIIEASGSLCAEQVCAILAGTFYLHPSRSGGVVHNKQNAQKMDLFNVICCYITSHHSTMPALRMEVQKAAHVQWRLPGWASVMVYDHNTQTVVHQGATKDDLQNWPQGMLITAKPKTGCTHSPGHQKFGAKGLKGVHTPALISQLR
jgi:hypothetical protein